MNLTSNKNYKEGLCNEMCPQAEIIMRERERLLHRLEMVAGTEKDRKPRAHPQRVVKAFTRSAADSKMSPASSLRPFNVLRKTVQYLVLNVELRNDVKILSKYDFINDRLRSVRQDMIIQSLPPQECIVLLVPMVRFHLLYGYRLCEMDPHNFDDVLNSKHLLECLKWLLICYDEVDSSTCDITNKMKSLELKEKDKKMHSNYDEDRALMESIYLLYNLGDTNPLIRYLSIGEKYKTQLLKTAFKLSLSEMGGNYVKVCKLMSELPMFAFCAAVLQLPKIQRRALRVMSHGFHSKMLSFDTYDLSKLLLFETAEELHSTCMHYGLTMKAGGVHFDRNTYKVDANFIRPKRRASLDKIIANLSPSQIYNT